MGKFIEKIKNVFSGKFVYKLKKKPAQPAGGEESKPKQESPKPEAQKQ